MDRLKKVGEKSRPKRWLPSEDEEPEKRGTSEKRTKQGTSFGQSLPTAFQQGQQQRVRQIFPVRGEGTSQQQQQQQGQQQQQQLSGSGVFSQMMQRQQRQLAGGGFTQPMMQPPPPQQQQPPPPPPQPPPPPPQQQQMNKQALMESLIYILQMLARANPQQKEQILQRMPHLSAEQKQQLLQKAQAMKQQMIQQQQQQQAQSTQQGFPGGGPGNMMGDNQSPYLNPATAGPSVRTGDRGSINTAPYPQAAFTPTQRGYGAFSGTNYSSPSDLPPSLAVRPTYPIPPTQTPPQPTILGTPLYQSTQDTTMSLRNTPRLEIVQQPPVWLWFHYDFKPNMMLSGGTSAAVKLVGYRGRARVMVTLVTDTDPPMPHAHSLVGKDTRDGRLITEMGVWTDMHAWFHDRHISRVATKKVPEVLYRRLLQHLKLRDGTLEDLDGHLEGSFSDDELSQVEKEAASMAKSMDLSVVRLCFQAYLMDQHGRFTIPVGPVYSHRVYNSGHGFIRSLSISGPQIAIGREQRIQSNSSVPPRQSPQLSTQAVESADGQQGSSAIGITNETLLKTWQQQQQSQPLLMTMGGMPTASFPLPPTTTPVPPTQTGFQQQESEEGGRAKEGGAGISLTSASTAPPQPQPEDVFGWSLPQTPDVQQADVENQKEAENLLYEAIEKGFVTSQHVVIILVGIAGSGKSSFKRVVLDLPLEEMRVSTPLAEATIRNISISRATISDSDSVVWDVVTSEKLLEMLAGAIKEVGVPQEPVAEPSASATTKSSSPNPTVATSAASLSSNPGGPVAVAEEESQLHDLPSTSAASLSSSPNPTVVNIDKEESGLRDLPSTSAASLSSSESPTVTDVTVEESESRDLQASASHDSSARDDSEVRSKASGSSAAQEHDEDLEFKDDPLLPLISRSKGSRRLLRVHWVYIIDTGGQPQFLQLLPAFIKNISSCVCLLRLDQDLDHKPLVKYFDQSGKQCGESYPSEYTNLQIIESCVRTIHSRCCLNSEKPPSCFVVGTHLDEYEKKIEAGEDIEKIEEKNSNLLKKLSNPQLEQSLTFYRSGDDNEKLIFPLNCKKPEERDHNVAAEFRKCVMSRCSESESKIPLAWFVLEERIRQYAVKKNVAYVERATCAKIASQLHMNTKIFEAALNHLLKLNIFRCYSSLPNLIFCDTQVVLFKLTELVQYSFQLRRAVIYGISGEDVSFKNEGIISIQFLSARRFSSFYSELFTAECFLKILRELLAVADMQGGKCFMPCLLNELSEKEISEHRSSSPSLSALLILLGGGCLPNGLFTSLVASLKNDHEWKLAYGGQRRKPICLYQNCVSFKVPEMLPGTVTLIASFKYLEVHVKCPIESEIDNICTRVFHDIKSGLEASWRVLYPEEEVSFSLAFFCNSCPGTVSTESCFKVQLHHADICRKGRFETCSVHPSCGSSLSEPKLRWLRNANYLCPITQAMITAMAMMDEGHSSAQSLGDIEAAAVTQQLRASSSEFQRYLSQLPVSAFPYLNMPLDWDNDYDRDLVEIAKQLLRWEELLVCPFKLSRADIHGIKTTNQESSELQRREVLRKWQDKIGLDATYKCLLEILVTAQHIEGAKAVCRVLKRRGLGKHPSGAQGEDLPPSKQSKQQ